MGGTLAEDAHTLREVEQRCLQASGFQEYDIVDLYFISYTLLAIREE